MKWHLREKKLPEPGKWVLAVYGGGNWSCGKDYLTNCIMVSLVKGISKKARQKMIDGKLKDPIVDYGWCLSDGSTKGKRSAISKFGDEDENNLVPYHWKGMGSSDYFGQDIFCWAYFDIPIFAKEFLRKIYRKKPLSKEMKELNKRI